MLGGKNSRGNNKSISAIDCHRSLIKMYQKLQFFSSLFNRKTVSVAYCQMLLMKVSGLSASLNANFAKKPVQQLPPALHYQTHQSLLRLPTVLHLWRKSPWLWSRTIRTTQHARWTDRKARQAGKCLGRTYSLSRSPLEEESSSLRSRISWWDIPRLISLISVSWELQVEQDATISLCSFAHSFIISLKE